MAHKTLIGGTAYEISGGKTLIDGTSYSIKNGKTLIGGTAYEVGFGSNIVTVDIIDEYDEGSMWVEIGKVRYGDTVSGIEVKPGDVIIFDGSSVEPGDTEELIIDGETVATGIGLKEIYYKWTVPEGISKILIRLEFYMTTVTTS